MKLIHTLAATALVAILATPAFAQDASVNANLTAGSETQRDVNQQDRIENGLKSGELNSREASKLEAGEARIDRQEARDMKDGTLSASEKARLQREQNAESKAIYNQKHDAQTGNPDSKSSERMQRDVARDANQEKRIEAGEKNGTLTKREASRLEGEQARTDREESRAGRNGVSAKEQARINRNENKDSNQVYKKKHNRRHRKAS